jgi:hypothetical protein
MSRNEMLENKDWNVYLTEQKFVHGIEALFRCFCREKGQPFVFLPENINPFQAR